ncbi:hypothetical protein [Cerasicoccus maritimus]|uniref:hypothetical protein n=1 Tax=Cerasicoccus maritimus TaxID=490089 RepID=UPI002852A72F|nr:hypothetical protein [Cerasicoccus maritimus]
MNDSLDQCLELLSQHPSCLVKPLPEGTVIDYPGTVTPMYRVGDELIPMPSKTINRFPEDALYFRSKIAQLRIFSEGENSWQLNNGWHIDHPEYWGSESVVEHLLGSEEELDDEPEHPFQYFRNCIFIGNSSADGGDLLGMDLHPDRLGWIMNMHYQDWVGGGGFPLIAKSFMEWLTRPIKHGADAEEHYWYCSDFQKIGPALPDDSEYAMQ